MEVDIVCFSDTHNYHKAVVLPPCDIAIFSGDFSSRGSKADTENFLDWYTEQRQCVYKVLIPGNHDLCFDPKFNKETLANQWLPELLTKYKCGEDFYYLENTSINLLGLNIWGSPITPDFYPEYWAFNKPRGGMIKAVWDSMPLNTDIAVTHGPCKFIGDYIPSNNQFVGCADLSTKIKEVKPKLHISGHIHEGYCLVEKEDTIYVNASICNEHYHPINPPILITLQVC